MNIDRRKLAPNNAHCPNCNNRLMVKEVEVWCCNKCDKDLGDPFWHEDRILEGMVDFSANDGAPNEEILYMDNGDEVGIVSGLDMDSLLSREDGGYDEVEKYHKYQGRY